MTKRRTKIGIAIGIGIAVILIVVVIGAATGIGAGIGLGAPGIPHPLQGRDDCVSCHSSGAHQYPEWHAERSYDSDRCTDCHHPNENEEDSSS